VLLLVCLTCVACVARSLLQLGFVEFVVRPLFVTLARIAPPLGSCLRLIDRNKEAWAALVQSSAAADNGA
jgi:hypothetical protein